MRSKTIGSSTTSDNTGGATADYTSIAGWEASIADTDSETGTVITKVNPTDTSNVTLNATLTSGHTALLTADSSCYVNAPTYAAATSRARVTAGMTISASGFTIEKIRVAGATFNNALVMNGASAVVRRVNFGTRYGSGLVATGTQTSVASNCFCYEDNDGGVSVYCTSSATLTIYHFSVLVTANTYAGVLRDGGTFASYSTVVNGPVTNFSGTNGGDYNVSEDATAPGANSLQSQTGVFTNTSGGSENLTLSGSVSVNIVDRSSFPADTDTDIVGTTRPSTGADAGCWQTPSTPSGPTPIDNTKFSRRGKGRTLPVPATIGH